MGSHEQTAPRTEGLGGFRRLRFLLAPPLLDCDDDSLVMQVLAISVNQLIGASWQAGKQEDRQNNKKELYGIR